jgi:uncharacterized heparinase superfamily protein
MPPRREPSLSAETHFCFFNEVHDLDTMLGWDNPAVEKLWRYNLHYFDTLNAENAEQLHDQHRSLLVRWIRDNPPGKGSGWEPYPTSLRIVNWIKWALAGNSLDVHELESLATQVRWLSSRLEIHLLGNHLFANAKALVFAGLFFSGQEAEKWLKIGLRTLAKEIPEQILPDGGQFERSTMYHALALEDMLDLLNLMRAFDNALDDASRAVTATWSRRIAPMHAWLATMSHPDRQISFFNDSAFGIAVPTEKLDQYAARLGYQFPADLPNGVSHLVDSGYVRIQSKDAVALLDVGPIGPDYLPGHAHADTLSFELSLFAQRIFVNSGTSQYGLGAERLRQRSTAAHNTVVIDQQNSSEVWSGFRVARRAIPKDLHIAEDGGMTTVACSHDGYRRLVGKNIHRRIWISGPGYLELTDEVTGYFEHAETRFYLHPDVSIQAGSSEQFCRLTPLGGQEIRFSIDGGTLEIQTSTWHPYFGVSLTSMCLLVHFTGCKTKTRISWNDA